MYGPLTNFNQNTFRNGRVVKNDDIKAVIKAFGQAKLVLTIIKKPD